MSSAVDVLAAFQLEKIAEVDATQQFLIACLFATESFEKFQEKVRLGISAVEIDTSMITNSDAAQLEGKFGYIIEIEPYGESVKRDYVRGDDGIIIIYDTFDKARTAYDIYEKFKPTIVDIETRKPVKVEVPRLCV